jgi:uncharacterized membrane protein (DUF441 family)
LNLAKSFVGVGLPLVGKFTLEYSIPYAGGRITTETLADATLTQEYWTALAAGILSAIAKTVHGRISESL